MIEDLKKTEISPAEVHCYEGKMIILEDTIVLKKQEFKDWETPIFYFKWNEPEEDSKNNSTIKQLEKALKDKGIEVTLIDYGLLEKH